MKSNKCLRKSFRYKLLFFSGNEFLLISPFFTSQLIDLSTGYVDLGCKDALMVALLRSSFASLAWLFLR